MLLSQSSQEASALRVRKRGEKRESFETAANTPSEAQDIEFLAELDAYVDSITPKESVPMVVTTRAGCNVNIPYDEVAVASLKKLGGRWDKPSLSWWLAPQHHVMVCRIARYVSPGLFTSFADDSLSF